MEILYFKAPRIVNIVQKRRITVSDLGELQGKPELVHQAKSLEVTHVKKQEKQRILISIMDVIQTVQKNLKDTCVVNIGSADIILSFQPQKGGTDRKMEKPFENRTYMRAVVSGRHVCDHDLSYGCRGSRRVYGGTSDLYRRRKCTAFLADRILCDRNFRGNHRVLQSFFEEETFRRSDTGRGRICGL